MQMQLTKDHEALNYRKRARQIFFPITAIQAEGFLRRRNVFDYSVSIRSLLKIYNRMVSEQYKKGKEYVKPFLRGIMILLGLAGLDLCEFI